MTSFTLYSFYYYIFVEKNLKYCFQIIVEMGFINDILIFFNSEKVDKFNNFYKKHKIEIDEFCKGSTGYQLIGDILTPSIRDEFRFFKKEVKSRCDDLFENKDGEFSYKQMNFLLRHEQMIKSLYQGYSIEKNKEDKIWEIRRAYPEAYEKVVSEKKYSHSLTYEQREELLNIDFNKLNYEIQFEKEILNNIKRRNRYKQYFSQFGKEDDIQFILNHIEDLDKIIIYYEEVIDSLTMSYYLEDFLKYKGINPTDKIRIAENKDELYEFVIHKIEYEYFKNKEEIGVALPKISKIANIKNYFGNEINRLKLEPLPDQKTIDYYLRPVPTFKEWLKSQALEQRGTHVYATWIFHRSQYDGKSVEYVKGIYKEEAEREKQRLQNTKKFLSEREEKIKKEEERIKKLDEENIEFSKKFFLITHPKFRKLLVWLIKQENIITRLNTLLKNITPYSDLTTRKLFKYKQYPFLFPMFHYLPYDKNKDGIEIIDPEMPKIEFNFHFQQNQWIGELNFEILQLFHKAYCYADLDYSSFSDIKDNTIEINYIKRNFSQFNWDIQSVIEIIKNLNKEFNVFVIIGRNTDAIETICMQNINTEIKEILAEINIKCYESDEEIKESEFQDNSLIIVLEGLSNNEGLKLYASELIKKYGEYYPLIVWLSLRKEYCQAEMQYLIDAPVRKKEKEEKLFRANKLLSENKDAIKYILPQIPLYNLTGEEQEKLLQYENQLIEYQSKLNNLSSKVKNWGKLGSLPYYYFFNYYPVDFDEISEYSDRIREGIWKFKDGLDIVLQPHYLLENILSQFFTKEELSQMVFVCVPSSSKESNDKRYQFFSVRVSERTGLINGFKHLKVRGVKNEKHLKKTKEIDEFEEEYSIELDKNFFNGKFIILFDDIVTSGSTMLEMKRRIEEVGAIVICALSLGKTVREIDVHNPKPHPFNGKV